MSADIQKQFHDAVAAHRDGEHSRTIEICDEIRSVTGDRPEVLNLKAVALAESGQMIRAREAILAALEKPVSGSKPGDRAVVLLHAARISSALDLFNEAFDFVSEAAKLRPADSGVIYQRSRLALLLGDFDLANKLVQECLDQFPQFREAQMLQAQIAMESGRLDDAETCYEDIVQAAPGHARALAGLAEIRRLVASSETNDESANDSVLTSLRAIHGPMSGGEDWATATFALADAHVRGGDHNSAFNLYQQANQHLAANTDWDIEAWNLDVSRKINQTIWNVQSSGHSTGLNPLFIVGMPRSGSSLLERMLGGHPLISTGGERQALPFIERHLGFSTKAPGQDLAEQMRALYRKGMTGAPGQKWVCDKANRNFERVNLVATLFPQGRTIWIIRNPLDTIVSCYFQDFQHGLTFTHSLDHLTQMYFGHWRLMNRWQEIFGDSILPVQYESLVGNTESVLQVVCDFLDVDFDAAMLEPHLQRNAVRTASTLQVQQPVHKGSLGRWRHYEEHLEVIAARLRSANIIDEEGNTLLPAGVL